MLSHDTVDCIVAQGAQQVHGQAGHDHDTAGGRPATRPSILATRLACSRGERLACAHGLAVGGGGGGGCHDTIGRIVIGGRPGC